MRTELDPAGFAKALLVESSDIPPHMTLAQWRLEKRAAEQLERRRRRRRRRIMRVLRRRAR
jgi:hypothetical protein